MTRWLTAVVVSLSLLLAGCSSDDATVVRATFDDVADLTTNASVRLVPPPSEGTHRPGTHRSGMPASTSSTMLQSARSSRRQSPTMRSSSRSVAASAR